MDKYNWKILSEFLIFFCFFAFGCFTAFMVIGLFTYSFVIGLFSLFVISIASFAGSWIIDKMLNT